MKMKTNGKAHLVNKAIWWGTVSLAVYAALFMNEKTVISYFATGGYPATLAVIVTAFVFSLVHGTFAHYVVELAGLQPNCAVVEMRPRRYVHTGLDDCDVPRARVANL